MSATKTILIVDDDRDLRLGLQTILRQKGFQTIEAEDGQDAKSLIDGKRPDLVILDMMMPRWGGFMVLEQYQNKADAPPFIMITADEGEKNKAYAEKAGVVDFIRKPFSLSRLMEGVEKGLREADVVAPLEKIERGILRFACQGCGARIKAPLKMLGETHSCPRCARSFVVRPQPPEDEGPRLVLDLGSAPRR